MQNMVEAAVEDQHQSPCAHGNIVDGHACYCHSPSDATPRKCPIWRHYGEADLSKWHAGGDFDDMKWEGGCKWFEAPNNAVLVERYRAAFEADAEPYGFDLTRQQCAAPEPWSEYADDATGHRRGGWLAAMQALERGHD